MTILDFHCCWSSTAEQQPPKIGEQLFFCFPFVFFWILGFSCYEISMIACFQEKKRNYFSFIVTQQIRFDVCLLMLYWAVSALFFLWYYFAVVGNLKRCMTLFPNCMCTLLAVPMSDQCEKGFVQQTWPCIFCCWFSSPFKYIFFVPIFWFVWYSEKKIVKHYLFDCKELTIIRKFF